MTHFKFEDLNGFSSSHDEVTNGTGMRSPAIHTLKRDRFFHVLHNLVSVVCEFVRTFDQCLSSFKDNILVSVKHNWKEVCETQRDICYNFENSWYSEITFYGFRKPYQCIWWHKINNIDNLHWCMYSALLLNNAFNQYDTLNTEGADHDTCS